MAIHNSSQYMRYFLRKIMGLDVKLRRRTDGSLAIRSSHRRKSFNGYRINPVMLRRSRNRALKRIMPKSDSIAVNSGLPAANQRFVFMSTMIMFLIMALAYVYITVEEYSMTLISELFLY